MSTIQINGWRPGLQKVAHTKLLQKSGGLSLSEAKAMTDRLLSGERVVVRTASKEAARLLVAELSEVGAIAEITDDGRGSI